MKRKEIESILNKQKNKTVRLVFSTNKYNKITLTISPFQELDSYVNNDFIIIKKIKGFDGNQFQNLQSQIVEQLLKIEVLEKNNYWVTCYEAREIVYSLKEYINLFFQGSQKEFAIIQGVSPTQVTQWIKKEFVVMNNKLYSFRRDLTVGTCNNNL